MESQLSFDIQKVLSQLLGKIWINGHEGLESEPEVKSRVVELEEHVLHAQLVHVFGVKVDDGRIDQEALLQGVVLHQVRQLLVRHLHSAQFFVKDRVQDAAVDFENGLAVPVQEVSELVIGSVYNSLVVQLFEEFIDQFSFDSLLDLYAPIYQVRTLLFFIQTVWNANIVGEACQKACFWVQKSLALEHFYPALELHHLTDGSLHDIWALHGLLVCLLWVLDCSWESLLV